MLNREILIKLLWIFLLEKLISTGLVITTTTLAVTPDCSQVTCCQSVGEWGTWGEWTNCPTNAIIPLLNIRRRIRYCIPQPLNCTPDGEYDCL